MSYPSTIASFPTHVNGQVIDASDVNNIQTEVVAIETFVGTISSVAGTLENDIRNPLSNGGGHVQQANTGGTGQTSYNKGDVLVASSNSVLSKVAVGADGTVLTADSTQTAGLAWKTNTGATSFQNSFKAASSIVGGNGVLPVYITPFQSDGGILNDTSTTFSSVLAANQNPGSILTSINLGSHPNEVLVMLFGCSIGGGGSMNISSVMHGGSVLTQVDGLGATQFHLSSWYLLNPRSGVQSVLAKYNSSNTNGAQVAINSYGYYNAVQNSSIINSRAIETSSGTTSIVSSANGVVIVGMSDGTTLTGLPNNQQINNLGYSSGDSGQLFPPQSYTFTGNSHQSANGEGVAIALAPITVPDFQIALASGASSVQSATFIGFSTSSIASGQTGLVTVDGIVTGLSSLMSGSPYYLGNTTGTIQTTPGTIIRKVGIPISSVALILNNS